MATTPNTMTMMVNNPALADSLEQLAEAYESAANIARAQAESLRHGFPVTVDITLTARSNVMEGSPTPTTIPTLDQYEPGDPFSFMTPDTTTADEEDEPSQPAEGATTNECHICGEQMIGRPRACAKHGTPDEQLRSL